MSYLSAADATQLAAETQAQCLLGLEQLDAIETAARASLLGAFTSGQGYSADADYSPRAWLIHKTRITTKDAAVAHTAWVRRAAAHPQVVAALAEGHILSESVARTIGPAQPQPAHQGRVTPRDWIGEARNPQQVPDHQPAPMR
jgi:hypothetical protein